MTSMVFERLEHVIVVCHNRKTPSVDEWEAYLDLCRHSGIAFERLRSLIFTPGGGPNAKQRLRLQLGMRIHNLPAAPSAIVTDAWSVRQIVRVVSWFNPSIRAFASHDVEAAMDFLGIAPALRPTLLQAAARLELRLRMPETGGQGLFAASVDE